MSDNTQITPSPENSSIVAALQQHVIAGFKGPFDQKKALLAVREAASVIGMTAIAKETGLRRESLYKALGENGNPQFTTVSKVLQSMGLRLAIVPRETTEAQEEITHVKIAE